MELQESLFVGTEFEERLDDKYTKKLKIPQYEPTMQTKPFINQLVDATKFKKLVQEIEKSNVSNEDKKFLKYAAARHLVFNYSLIAEYYAQSSKEVQELMEKSALVIIDFDDAIANGYVKLSDNIKKIMLETGRNANEEYHNQARDTRNLENDEI